MKTLSRQLGLASVLGISMGAMLGSGLFVLPGLAILQTGPSVWLAYLVAGVCVLPAALSKAELATAMPVSGGTYVYIDRTFGPLASTIGGIGLWVSLLLKSAFALVGFGAYLRVLTNAPVTAIGLGLLVVIVVLNIVGIRKVGKMQVWVVLLSISGLVLVTCIALGTPYQPQPETIFSNGGLGFLGTVGFVYISYAGVTKVAAVAEEVKNPGRNLPLGILLSLGTVVVLYSIITYVLVTTVPLELLEGDLKPIHTLALHTGGSTVGNIMAFLGILTMTSMANAGLMAASRFPFAMSREHLLPSSLSRVNERFMTPAVSIILTGVMMAAAILFLDVAGIAKLASSLMILAFMAVNLAVIVLRESGVAWYRPVYHAPLYPMTQIIGLIVGAVLLVMLGWTGLVAITAVAAIGFFIYAAFGRRRTDRTGVMGRLGPRRDIVAEPPQHEGEAESKEAAVVVPLIGQSVPTEALVEIAGALSHGGLVEVVHLTEVPEQLMLDSGVVDETQVESLARRTRRIARDHELKVEFDTLVTRDLARSIHDASRRVHCDWVVLEWRGRLQRGFLPFRPLGWLVEHLACNLAVFKNRGLRVPNEILVLPKPGPHDALVATTADHLAELHGSQLTFVRYVHVEATSLQRQLEMDYLEQISSLCKSQPTVRLVQGRDKVETLSGITAGFDLMVLGAAPHLTWRESLRGSFPDRLTDAAACSVLRLRTPREETHRSVARNVSPSQADDDVLENWLAPGCLQARLEPMGKEALFAHFAAAFSSSISGNSPGHVPPIESREIEEALWEREKMQNTAVEQGLALPHATVSTADRAWLGIFTSRTPVDYKAPNDSPVDVFVLTLGPPSARNTHLQILARVSQLVLETDLLEQLRNAKNESELHAALRSASDAASLSKRNLEAASK